MAYVDRQQLVLNCDRLMASVDKSSWQFSQFMALTGSTVLHNKIILKAYVDPSMENIFI